MSEIDELERRMDEASRALDFEQARQLRDQLNLLRGGASLSQTAASDTSGLSRQQPGAMGLGTSQQRMRPQPGWKPPAKPDLMTTGKPRQRGRRSSDPK